MFRTVSARFLLTLVAGIQLVTGCALKRYSGHGLVLEVNRPDRTVVVSHDQIPGYMEAMVMPFHVGDPRLLAQLKPGDRIRFRLAVGKKGSYLDRVAVESAAPVAPADWQTPVTSRILVPGEPVPNFELTDQTGRRVSISQLRGRVIAVNFIYTPCPLPGECAYSSPALDRLKPSLRNLNLLSVERKSVTDTILPGTSSICGSSRRQNGACHRFSQDHGKGEFLIWSLS